MRSDFLSALILLSSLTMNLAGQDLRTPRNQYETEMMKLMDGTVAEASEALVVLAELNSPLYEQARNKAMNTKEEMAGGIVKALIAKKDASQEAVDFLESCIRSNSERLVFLATPAIREIPQIRIQFTNIWDRNQQSYFWHVYSRWYGTFEDQIDGIGTARPWRDKSWKTLDGDTKLTLLSRAGTKEATEYLLQALNTEKQQDYDLTSAEPVDLPHLKSLMNDARPTIKKYACLSLRKAGDPACLQRVEELITSGQFEELARFQLPWWELLSELSSQSLRKFVLSGHSNLEHDAYSELLKRGETISMSQMVATDPALKERYALNLKIGQAISTKNYDLLLPILKEILSQPDVETYELFGLLHAKLLSDLSVISEMPEHISHQLILHLQNWVAGKNPLGSEYRNAIESSIRSALLISGLIAKSSDGEAQWNQWRTSAKPLDDLNSLLPVFGAQNKRSEKVRRILAGTRVNSGHMWNQFRYLAPETQTKDYCPPFQALASELPITFLSQTSPRVIQATADFGKTLRHLSTASSNKSLESTVLPEPSLSGEDEQWLNDVLSEDSKKQFQELVDRITNPQQHQYFPVVAHSTAASIHILGPFPNRGLLTAADSHLEEIRNLTHSDNRTLRDAAILALWYRTGEESLLSTWMKEVESSDPSLKARALNNLHTILYEKARPFYADALLSTDAAVKQAGLLGVQRLRMHEQIPVVIQLLSDPDPAIADTAIQTLGVVRSKEAFFALIQRLERNSNILIEALSQYREAEYVTVLAEKWTKIDRTSPSYAALLKILSKVTLLDQFIGDWNPEPYLPEWIVWWRKNRKSDVDDWAKYWIEKLVRESLAKADPSVVQLAANRLNNLFGDLQIDDPERKKQNRERLSLWWSFMKDKSAWELLNSDMTHGPQSNRNLMMAIHPLKTLRHSFYEMNYCKIARSEEPYIHHLLVKYAGRDYGNPCYASCERKLSIASKWYDYLFAHKH